MRQSSLDITSRVRIASLLYKLAIRMQQVAKRPIDPGKAAMRMNVVLNGALAELRSYFTPAPGTVRGEPPTLAKALANRTFVPGHGPGIRLALFFGPLHLVETVDGLGAVTSQTKRDRFSTTGFSGRLETIDSLETIFPSKFGGVNPKIKVITADVREHSDKQYKIERGFDSGKRVWKIVDRDTGEVAHYELPAAAAQEAEDPFREAIFTSASEATRVLNELTRGTSNKSRVLPKFKEYLIYVQYSAVYLQSHPSGQVGEGMYEVLHKLLPDEESERSERAEQEAERILREEPAAQEEHQKQQAEEAEQARRRKLFDVARRR